MNGKFLDWFLAVGVIVSIVLLMMLSGCTKGAELNIANANREKLQVLTPIIYIDPETGCHYLSTAGNSITPRMTASGEHLCVEPK